MQLPRWKGHVRVGQVLGVSGGAAVEVEQGLQGGGPVEDSREGCGLVMLAQVGGGTGGGQGEGQVRAASRSQGRQQAGLQAAAVVAGGQLGHLPARPCHSACTP